MLPVKSGVSLKSLNTFGIDVKAAHFFEFFSIDELQGLIRNQEFLNIPKLVLGGGSNILFTHDFDGIVVRNSIPGIRVVEENEDSVLVQAGAGVVWHELVMWTVEKGLGGIENLSLIPGKTGAAPIQNIGAYGVELKDTFLNLEALEWESGNMVSFDASRCAFGYRDSYFKRDGKGKWIILSITLRLNKKPELKLSYGAIKDELQKTGIAVPSVADVSRAVVSIRSSKLPNPAVLGNAGSFFKNPELSEQVFNELKSKFPAIPAYPQPGGTTKIAAGWLIEQCGWKGKRIGNTGAHKDQALVLVNYGNASGSEILDLALKIQESVIEKFGVRIEPEVNIM